MLTYNKRFKFEVQNLKLSLNKNNELLVETLKKKETLKTIKMYSKQNFTKLIFQL